MVTVTDRGMEVDEPLRGFATREEAEAFIKSEMALPDEMFVRLVGKVGEDCHRRWWRGHKLGIEEMPFGPLGSTWANDYSDRGFFLAHSPDGTQVAVWDSHLRGPAAISDSNSPFNGWTEGPPSHPLADFTVTKVMSFQEKDEPLSPVFTFHLSAGQG